jgi:hypothetical protein
MCRSHHAIETRLHEEQKVCKKSSKLSIPAGLLPLRAQKKGRAAHPHHLSSAMQAMKPLIHRSHLVHLLALLTWGLTLSLMVFLDSMLHLLQHHHLLLLLLQSSQEQAWQMSSRLVSLVIQISVWLVAPLLLILLCHHSLTHPSTPGQEHIGLHLTTTPRMISRSNGLKLQRTPIPSIFDDC